MDAQDIEAGDFRRADVSLVLDAVRIDYIHNWIDKGYVLRTEVSSMRGCTQVLDPEDKASTGLAELDRMEFDTDPVDDLNTRDRGDTPKPAKVDSIYRAEILHGPRTLNGY